MTGYVRNINRRVVLLADVMDGNVTLIHLVNGEMLESSSRLTERGCSQAFVHILVRSQLDTLRVSNLQVPAACCCLGEKTLVASESMPPGKRRIGCLDFLIAPLTPHLTVCSKGIMNTNEFQETSG